jgi:hypothetical protein
MELVIFYLSANYHPNEIARRELNHIPRIGDTVVIENINILYRVVGVLWDLTNPAPKWGVTLQALSEYVKENPNVKY